LTYYVLRVFYDRLTIAPGCRQHLCRKPVTAGHDMPSLSRTYRSTRGEWRWYLQRVHVKFIDSSLSFDIYRGEIRCSKLAAYPSEDYALTYIRRRPRVTQVRRDHTDCRSSLLWWSFATHPPRDQHACTVPFNVGGTVSAECDRRKYSSYFVGGRAKKSLPISCFVSSYVAN
jgi:hypothetical protein